MLRSVSTLPASHWIRSLSPLRLPSHQNWSKSSSQSSARNVQSLLSALPFLWLTVQPSSLDVPSGEFTFPPLPLPLPFTASLPWPFALTLARIKGRGRSNSRCRHCHNTIPRGSWHRRVDRVDCCFFGSSCFRGLPAGGVTPRSFALALPPTLLTNAPKSKSFEEGLSQSARWRVATLHPNQCHPNSMHSS